MKVICTQCGSTHVFCEAWVNPNSGDINRFSDDSFNFGDCQNCDQYTILTDVDEVCNVLEYEYRKFKDANQKEPRYLCCNVAKNDNKSKDGVFIQMGSFSTDNPSDCPGTLLATCRDMEELKSWCDKSDKDFVIIGIQYFE